MICLPKIFNEIINTWYVIGLVEMSDFQMGPSLENHLIVILFCENQALFYSHIVDRSLSYIVFIESVFVQFKIFYLLIQVWTL